MSGAKSYSFVALGLHLVLNFYFQIAGSYWNTQYATNGVVSQIFATGFEDASYDAEILHAVLPDGSAEIPDTSCLNRDTIMNINKGSMKIEQQFADMTHGVNNNGSYGIAQSFTDHQNILVASRRFRKQTEV